MNDNNYTPFPNREVLKREVKNYLRTMKNGGVYESEYGPINKWNVSNVTDMSYIFSDFPIGGEDEDLGLYLSGVDLSNWDVSNVADISGMFDGCKNFDSDLSGWNVGAVTVMSGMFQYCQNFDSDLSNWDVSKVLYMSSMFYNCYNFTNFDNDLSKWNAAVNKSNFVMMKGMFKNCYNFRGLGLEKWKPNILRMNYLNTSDFKQSGFINGTLVNADAIKWLNSAPLPLENQVNNEVLRNLRPSIQVMATGNNNSGQLGIQEDQYNQLGLQEEDQYDKFTKVNIPTVSNVPIVSISTGESHTIALDCEGKIYAAGKNDKGQLGFEDTEDRSEFTLLPYSFMVKQIACGKDYTLIIDTNGQLYATGNNENGQLGFEDTENSQIGFKPITVSNQFDQPVGVKDVACGPDFTMVISDDNNAYSTGNNDNGQLGTGQDDTEPKTEFTKVLFSENGNVKKIACGGTHSMIIDTNNKLFGTGNNNKGQLGKIVPIVHGVFNPIINDIPNKNIKDVTCGNAHTVIVDYFNLSYSTGDNEFGQLGLDDKINRSEFTEVDFRYIARQISCGLNHTILSNTLNCYTTGDNSLGQLGLENNENQKNPTKVPNINNVYSIYSNCTAQSTFVIQIISGVLTPIPPTSNVKPCYNKNTKIKCLVDNTIQSVPVQNLTTNTRVLTRNGPKLVTKLTHHVQKNNKNDPNRMFRYKNLLLSGRHRTIVDFKPDKKLNPRTYSCGYSIPCSSDIRFTEVVSDSDFDLYNFTLENTDINHRDIIEIEGVLVETTSEWYLNKV